jgi:hypothetical protein
VLLLLVLALSSLARYADGIGQSPH